MQFICYEMSFEQDHSNNLTSIKVQISDNSIVKISEERLSSSQSEMLWMIFIADINRTGKKKNTFNLHHHFFDTHVQFPKG